ncbi:MAG: glycosyltransferase family 2 protein [Moorea sp. SIO2B7]|nr:glycosyltransferase family 2 protein [Moorena sp. SIO2B7]
MNNTPCVSIGLPVYNGENFIKQAIDCILDQTFEDFELIISDNASTDITEQICREYAAKDNRIRYYRNQKNIGAAPNFNQVFELSRGKYFKWAAHDDLCAPEFLELCVEVLENDDSIILCHSKTRLIIHDKQGKLKKEKNHTLELKTDSFNPQERFSELILIPHWCFQFFGVIRADILKNTPLIGKYAASDRGLLAELGLLGRFYEIPKYLFSYRIHPQHSVSKWSHNPILYTAWFDPAKKGRIVFPRWRLFSAYFTATRKTSLSWNERLYCYLHLGTWLQQNRKAMIHDLIVAAKQVLSPVKVLLKSSLIRAKQVYGYLAN